MAEKTVIAGATGAAAPTIAELHALGAAFRAVLDEHGGEALQKWANGYLVRALIERGRGDHDAWTGIAAAVAATVNAAAQIDAAQLPPPDADVQVMQ